MAGTVLGVDAGSPTAAEAEHLLLRLAVELGTGPGAVLCTHPVRVGTRHYAGTLTLPSPGAGPGSGGGTVLPVVAGAGVALASGETGGDPELAAPALAAARERAAGTAGRAVRFPGMEQLTGTVPVADVLAGTAIEEVQVLAGGVLPAGAGLVTRDFVRPEFRGGRLVLLVLPGGPGLVAPFELPNPTPCCAVHA